MEINKPIGAVIILILNMVVLFVFLLPAYSASSDLAVKQAEKQAEYNGKSVYFTKVSQLLGDIQNRKETLDKVNSSLPDTFAIAPLVYFLQAKAAQSGSIISSVSFAPASSENTQEESLMSEREVKEVSFRVSLLGNYQGLKNFLFALDHSVRLFEVDTLSLTPLRTSTGSNGVGTYSINLGIKTHTY